MTRYTNSLGAKFYTACAKFFGTRMPCGGGEGNLEEPLYAASSSSKGMGPSRRMWSLGMRGWNNRALEEFKDQYSSCTVLVVTRAILRLGHRCELIEHWVSSELLVLGEFIDELLYT
jgi:hypothetical protein